MEALRGGISEPEPCPYLPGRTWRNFVVDAGPDFSPTEHEQLLDLGFRRMGRFLYRPACEACQECRPLRVRVGEYRPSKSHRRAWNKNRDLEIVRGRPAYTEEKRALLERYLAARHRGPMTADEETMREFMFQPTAGATEFRYRRAGRLLAVGLVDLTPRVLSSLYFYFDPAEPRRSLGIYSMMVEIGHAADYGREFYHPGFYVAGCPAMEYKSRFTPSEVMRPDGSWRPMKPDRPRPGPTTRSARTSTLG